MSIQCPICKTLNRDTAAFCDKCGSRLKAASEPPKMSDLPQKPATIPEGDFDTSSPEKGANQSEQSVESALSVEDPSGVGWKPDTIPSDTPPSVPAAPLKKVRVPGLIEGEVRGLGMRSETTNTRNETVWHFRVESYDEAGNRLPPVAVEMHGQSFQGWIEDGDHVKITETRRKGDIITARKLYNESHGTWVEAKNVKLLRGAAIGLGVTFGIPAFVVILIVIIWLSLTQCSH